MNEDIFRNYGYGRYRLNARNRRQVTLRYTSRKIGRNEPCPCSSDKKYKKCCGKIFDNNRCHR